jgi:hypothetical protein
MRYDKANMKVYPYKDSINHFYKALYAYLVVQTGVIKMPRLRCPPPQIQF